MQVKFYSYEATVLGLILFHLYVWRNNLAVTMIYIGYDCKLYAYLWNVSGQSIVAVEIQ